MAKYTGPVISGMTDEQRIQEFEAERLELQERLLDIDARLQCLRDRQQDKEAA